MLKSDRQSLIEMAANMRRLARMLMDRKMAAKLNKIATDLEIAALTDGLGKERSKAISETMKAN